ncbi:MAG TPA: hypothetical protein VGM07_17145 [Stellaceae bacterium]|jgi:hypothetical protein
MSETVMGKPFAEAFAEALGEPLPADWRDDLAVQSRRDRLAALAYSAADGAVDLLLRSLDNCLHQAGRVSPGDPAVRSFMARVVDLDKGCRIFVREGGVGAAEVVADAAVFECGQAVADFVMHALDQYREAHRRAVNELETSKNRVFGPVRGEDWAGGQ